MSEEDIEKIVNDEDKVELYRSELQALLELPGWKIIRASLLQDIEEIEAKLHGDLEYAEGDTTKGLRDRREDRKGLFGLPEYLLRLLEENKGYPKNLDPYD